MDKLWHNRDWLEWHYVELRMSSIRMAQLAGCSDTTIVAWLKRHGIPRRSLEEAAMARRGMYDWRQEAKRVWRRHLEGLAEMRLQEARRLAHLGLLALLDHDLERIRTVLGQIEGLGDSLVGGCDAAEWGWPGGAVGGWAEGAAARGGAPGAEVDGDVSVA